MDTYFNRVDFDGVSLAAEAYHDDQVIKERFGYNVKKAGVTPINFIAENDSDDTLIILPGPTMRDAKGQVWDLLPQHVVVNRVSEFTGSAGVSGRDGVSRTAKGAVVGAVLGAALGIATGSNVGAAMGKGAAMGGAVGAGSAIMGVGGKDRTGEVAADYSNLAALQNILEPGQSTHGLLYFPGEADRPTRLNLKVRIGHDGKTKTVVLPL
jgi:hypothetical protein